MEWALLIIALNDNPRVDYVQVNYIQAYETREACERDRAFGTDPREYHVVLTCMKPGTINQFAIESRKP